MNEERIRLMTKLASYEQGKGQEHMAITQYYRGDYISFQMMKTFVCSTLAFGILALLCALYQMEDLMALLYRNDPQAFLMKLLALYIGFVGVFQIIAYLVFSQRHKRAYKGQRQCLSWLKKAARLRESEETGGQL